MSSVSEKTVIRARTAPAPLRISNWPLRDEPVQSGIVIGFIVALSVIGATAVHHYAMGLVLFALFALSVRRIWAPAVYELSSKGIVYARLGRKRRIPWSEFARYETRNGGVLLCADVDPNPFSAWHSLFIRCSDRRDEILAIVEFYLQGPLQTALLSTRSLSHVSPPPEK